MMKKIIVLTNKEFVGDNNQVQGILAAMQATPEQASDVVISEESEFDVDNIDPQAVILTAGDNLGRPSISGKISSCQPLA